MDLVSQVLDSSIRNTIYEDSRKPHRYGIDYHVLNRLLHTTDEEIEKASTPTLYALCIEARTEGVNRILHHYYEERRRATADTVPFGQFKGMPYSSLSDEALKSVYGFLHQKYRGDEDMKACYLEQVTFELNRRKNLA